MPLSKEEKSEYKQLLEKEKWEKEKNNEYSTQGVFAIIALIIGMSTFFCKSIRVRTIFGNRHILPFSLAFYENSIF